MKFCCSANEPERDASGFRSVLAVLALYGAILGIFAGSGCETPPAKAPQQPPTVKVLTVSADSGGKTSPAKASEPLSTVQLFAFPDGTGLETPPDQAFKAPPEADVVKVYTCSVPEAIKLIGESDYPDALAMLNVLAGLGDTEAMFRLGGLYHEGLGVPHDEAQAYSWYEKGAVLGDPGCQAMTGEYLLVGLGVKEDETVAENWFIRAAVKGNSAAMRSLVRLYNERWVGGQPQTEKVRIWRQKILDAEGNSPSAEIEFLGGEAMDELDRGYASDAIIKLRGYEDDADLQVANQARVALARALLLSPLDSLRSPEEARHLILDAVTGGNPGATVLLGEVLAVGTKGMPPDIARAKAVFDSLGGEREAGLVLEAAVELHSRTYPKGYYEASEELLQIAADKGEPGARHLKDLFARVDRAGQPLKVDQKRPIQEQEPSIQIDPTDAEIQKRIAALGSRGNTVQPRPVFMAPPVYPFDMRAQGITGKAVVSFIVGPDGRVYRALAKSSTVEPFGEAAVAAVERWRFAPGLKDGHPVSVMMEVPINFSLENPPKAR